jgi:hypothetical protein
LVEAVSARGEPCAPLALPDGPAAVPERFDLPRAKLQIRFRNWVLFLLWQLSLGMRRATLRRAFTAIQVVEISG